MKARVLSLVTGLFMIAALAHAAATGGPTLSRVIADYEHGMLNIEGTNLNDHTEVLLGAAGGALVPMNLFGVSSNAISAQLPPVAPGTYTLVVNTGSGNNQGQKFTVTATLTFGTVGPQGPQGIQGPKGDKGDKGDQGIQGVKGDKGDQGIQGIQGVKGDKGEKGDKGDQGIQGIQGVKGDKGDQGIQGVKGDKGDQGIQGIQGVKGDKGDQGVQGIQGVKGDKGDTGSQGPQGFTGAKGDKGDKGDPGTPVAAWREYRTSCDGDHICTTTWACGSQIIAGGCGHYDWNSAAQDVEVAYSGPVDQNTWRCTIDNTSGSSRAYEIWILCQP